MIRKIRFWPVHGWVGLVSVTVCWLLNWMLPGVRTAYLFFPLWLGYVLVVDAMVRTRVGSSIWSRSRKDFVLLFCFSAPVWWLFELFNRALPIGNTSDAICSHRSMTICFAQLRFQLSFPQSLKLRS